MDNISRVSQPERRECPTPPTDRILADQFQSPPCCSCCSADSCASSQSGLTRKKKKAHSQVFTALGVVLPDFRRTSSFQTAQEGKRKNSIQ